MKKILVLAMCLYAGAQASDKPFERALKAMHSSDLPLLRAAYHDDPTILTTRFFNGLTLLHDARKIDLCEFLIMVGSDLNAVPVTGSTPLLLAVGRGHDDIVDLLLKHKADIKVDARNCHTALTMIPGSLGGMPANHPKAIRIKSLLAQAQASEKELKQQEKVSNSSE